MCGQSSKRGRGLLSSRGPESITSLVLGPVCHAQQCEADEDLTADAQLTALPK